MEKETSFQFRKLVQHIAPIIKVVCHDKQRLSRTAQDFRISNERYFESEKGAQRALQAGYLGWNKHRFILGLAGI
ncbi:hypothetical protein [Escherichia coli]|uniref:hypothetical protein n=1 Tax=Escherichia coli TaxID=562 RepID=UPI001A92F80A|nr:hypothetical protein [Escherichia coli]MBO0270153.1 hypothetical protein [Escherichia coli]